MATVGTPIYMDNLYVGSIHHDVMLDDIFSRMLAKDKEERDKSHLEIDISENYILRNDGRLILHPRFQDEIVRKQGNLNVHETGDSNLLLQYKSILAAKENSDQSVIATDNDYLVYYEMAHSKWYLIHVIKKISIFREIGLILIFMGMSFYFLMIIFLIKLYIQKTIQYPLMMLKNATDQYAQGNFDFCINLPERNDELGYLADSFFKMGENIKSRDLVILEHSHQLEKMVEERTKELGKSKEAAFNMSKFSALGEMASGMAHEINNPLTIIIGKIQLLKKEFKNEKDSSELIEKNLNKIEHTAYRIAKIIKGLKSFSRNAEKDPFQKVSLHEIIEDTLSFCCEKFKAHDVELFYDPVDVMINCRPTQISQVLLNLLNNSFDAIVEDFKTKGGKWIKIKSLIKTEAHTRHILISVTDCGDGISKENLEKLMTPFFTTKEVGKGTGLGLSISKGIMEDHQGHFYYDHEQKNTTFVIVLPVAGSTVRG
jgi:C4-dicarboxylate-specific signal transduction histidine kinase